MIKHSNMVFTKDGVCTADGRVIWWDDIHRILDVLPEIAHERMGWFNVSGPPSDCIRAIEEIKMVNKALFKQEAP